MTIKVQKQVAELAADALRRCKGDTERAKEDMRDLLFQRKALLHDLITEIVDAAVDNCVRYTHRTDNRLTLAHVAKRQTTVEEDQVAARQSAARVLLLEVTLGDGTKLAAARRPQLLTESAFHGKQSSTMYLKAVFFAAIAKQLPDDKIPVGRVLDEEHLRAIFKRAQSQVDAADIFQRVSGTSAVVRA